MHILLVEGNSADKILIEKAFELGGTANIIHTVKNGNEARACLQKESPFESAVKPDLIILDIEFNGDGGLNLLNELKGNSEYSTIPIVALTHTADSQEIIASYEKNVNCLIKKPLEVRNFLTVIKAIDYFWTEIVSLPHETQ